MAAKRNIIVNAASASAVLSSHESVSRQAVDQLPLDDLDKAALIGGINNALIEIRDHEADPNVLSSPTSAMASQLQSFLAMKAIEEDKPKARDLIGGAEEAKFDSHDWLGWAKSFFTWRGRLGKAGWLDAPTVPESMPDNARIALFADWGTGLYGAPAVSKCISTHNPAFTHVIHLGDIYYSGTEREVDERQMPFWPNVAGAISRACNANHEMYCGGSGYFHKVLPLFGQNASYFVLENNHWIIVGLDTAYDDPGLNRAHGAINRMQLVWLTTMLNNPAHASKKLVLLSHHQPFSRLEQQGFDIISCLRLLLDSRRVHAWYWGHEHRCVVYDPHPQWGVSGRCIGHGGYPYFRDTQLLQSLSGVRQDGAGESTWYRLNGMTRSADQSRVPGGLVIPGAIVLDGPNPYLEGDAYKYGPHGYVTLEFAGDTLFETYFTPQEPGPMPVAITVRRQV